MLLLFLNKIIWGSLFWLFSFVFSIEVLSIVTVDIMSVLKLKKKATKLMSSICRVLELRNYNFLLLF